MSTMKGTSSNCLVNTPMSTGESMNEEKFFWSKWGFPTSLTLPDTIVGCSLLHTWNFSSTGFGPIFFLLSNSCHTGSVVLYKLSRKRPSPWCLCAFQINCYSVSVSPWTVPATSLPTQFSPLVLPSLAAFSTAA